MTIITVGIDLAKNVFAVHGMDENGKAVLVQPKVARDQLAALIADLPPCLIGMEACTGAHHWARLFQGYGHQVRLIAPKFVAPYRMSGKRGNNDAQDAAAICEAVTRPHMRSVPIKNTDQQSLLCLRRDIGPHLDTPPGWANRCIDDLLTKMRSHHKNALGWQQYSAIGCMTDATTTLTCAG